MNFPQLAASYLTANALIVVAFSATVFVAGAFRFFRKPLLFSAELKLHYLMVFAVVAIALAAPLLPKQDIFQPVVKVWTSPSRTEFNRQINRSASEGYLDLSTEMRPSMRIQNISFIATWFFAMLLSLGFLKLLFDLCQLYRFKKKSYGVRKIHDVSILANDQIRVPLSFWIPGERNVVVPSALIGTDNFRSAVLHELQHHRQHDTKWVYLLWVLRVIFFLNPLIHLWNRRISEIQEFACDEALVDQGKVESLAYASCLVQVAAATTNHAINRGGHPVCATGLIFMIDRNMLKRRITAMLEQKRVRFKFGHVVPMIALIVASLGATAYGTQGLIQDRRVTLSQAEEMAKIANRSGDGFPVVVNELVVRWLNYYLGTPDGREKVHAALMRMETYKAGITRKLDEYQIPQELLAIPLIEAGFQNLAPRQNPIGAAGLWQFMAQTAQNFGLRVDDQVDERLNVELETDAAMRLLLANKLRFKDWQLSILSYNAGEGAVQQAIGKTGSRDAWVLVRHGFTNQESMEYLPKLMAAILIIRNPSAVQ